MSTRCTVKIEGLTFAKLYIHRDGYPEAKLPFLKDFNKDFESNRSKDVEYKFAQLLRATHRLQDEYVLDPSPYTGYGITPYASGAGEDYEYTLHIDGSVTYVSTT